MAGQRTSYVGTTIACAATEGEQTTVQLTLHVYANCVYIQSVHGSFTLRSVPQTCKDRRKELLKFFIIKYLYLILNLNIYIIYINIWREMNMKLPHIAQTIIDLKKIICKKNRCLY